MQESFQSELPNVKNKPKNYPVEDFKDVKKDKLDLQNQPETLKTLNLDQNQNQNEPDLVDQDKNDSVDQNIPTL